MKQKTTAQIREEVRKDLTKTFEKKYQYLVDDVERYKRLYNVAKTQRNNIYKGYNELKDENEALKEKITQYEDWIERLHFFMDINDDEERKAAFETYIKEKQSSREFSSLMNVYTEMFNRLFV